MKTNLLKIGTLLAAVAAMASCGGTGSVSSSTPSSSVPSSEASTSSVISSSAEPSSVPSSSAEPSSETPVSSDTEPASEATSSQETSTPEQPSPLQILAEDLAATNVTLDYTVVDYANVKYQFMDGIALYCEPDSEGEMVPFYYHVLRDHSIDSYVPNPDGTASYGWNNPYPYETLTIDFTMEGLFKDTMASAFASVDPNDVVEEDGVYHIEAAMLHLEAALVAKWWGLKFMPVNDGLEYPLFDVSFTLEDGHLATLAWSMYDQGVDSETKEIYLQEYYRSIEIAFSEYGTTSFDVPEAISGGSSSESSSGGIAPTPTPTSSTPSSSSVAPTPSSSAEPEPIDPSAKRAFVDSALASNVSARVMTTVDEESPVVSVFLLDGVYGMTNMATYDGTYNGYLACDFDGVRSYAFTTGGKYVEGPTAPWKKANLDLDFVLCRNFKENLSDLFLTLGRQQILNYSGVYAIEELLFHIDAKAMAAASGYVGEITNDGLACPMMNITFTFDGSNRLATFCYQSHPIGIVDGELVLNEDSLYTCEVTLGGYDQIKLDIPDAVATAQAWVAYPQVKEEIDKGAEYVYGADVYTLDWEHCSIFANPYLLGRYDLSAFAPDGKWERYFTYPTEEPGKTGNLIADYPSGTPFDEEVLAAILASNVHEINEEPLVEQDCYELFAVQALRYPR